MTIFLFGATGYTGSLTAHALVQRGIRPVLLGRSPHRLRTLADEVGGADTAVAEAEHPQALQALVAEGDVLISTVGPFMTKGWAALQAATQNRAIYIDSTGEPAFVRKVFTEIGPTAQTPLLPAFGYDYVPGNLAGALALQEAGDAARHVSIGYFLTGRGAPSSGTVASVAAMLAERSHAFRAGEVVEERPAARTLHFTVDGGRRLAVTIGGSEHWQLPRLAPMLETVDVAVGWFQGLSPALTLWSTLTDPIMRTPVARGLASRLAGRLAARTGAGPDAGSREPSGSLIVAHALDARRRPLAEVRLTGPDGYSLTATLLAWAADRAVAGDLTGIGARGPIDAFGLDGLQAGAADAGLTIAG